MSIRFVLNVGKRVESAPQRLLTISNPTMEITNCSGQSITGRRFALRIIQVRLHAGMGDTVTHKGVGPVKILTALRFRNHAAGAFTRPRNWNFLRGVLKTKH